MRALGLQVLWNNTSNALPGPISAAFKMTFIKLLAHSAKVRKCGGGNHDPRTDLVTWEKALQKSKKKCKYLVVYYFFAGKIVFVKKQTDVIIDVDCTFQKWQYLLSISNKNQKSCHYLWQKRCKLSNKSNNKDLVCHLAHTFFMWKYFYRNTRYPKTEWTSFDLHSSQIYTLLIMKFEVSYKNITNYAYFVY